MTAEQIREFLELEVPAEEVDEYLLNWWEPERRRRRIRPAKYPGLTTGLRLWGHVENVGSAPRDLEPRYKGQSVALEPLKVPLWAPQAFVSYSFHDLHLAARIRLFLGFGHSVRCWLASEMLEKDDLIFEGVREALMSSQLVVVLVTACSLGSAWMHTELETALGFLGEPHVSGRARPIVFAFDASDKNVLAVVQQHVLGRRELDAVLLDPLLIAYAEREADEHRRSQYRNNAQRILAHIKRGVGKVTLYPSPLVAASRGLPISIEATISQFAKGVGAIIDNLSSMISESDNALLAERASDFASHGAPEALAMCIAKLALLSPACDIVRISVGANISVEQAGEVYFFVGANFGFDWLRRAAGQLPTNTMWDKLAVATIIDDLFSHQGELTSHILSTTGNDSLPETIEDFRESMRPFIAWAHDLTAESRESGSNLSLAILAVATRRLKRILG
jgi:hypothetical protein